MIKLSEGVHRLEDTIESLKRDNQELRSKVGTVADLQKKVTELSRELLQRVKQVEDLLSSYKVLQEENKKLKSKLEQTVDEYDEDYQTFNDELNDDLRNMTKGRIDVEDFFNKRMR